MVSGQVGYFVLLFSTVIDVFAVTATILPFLPFIVRVVLCISDMVLLICTLLIYEHC